MQITVLNQKGGVGKSTVAILLGAALESAGFQVAFDDRDPQNTVSDWAQTIGKIPLVGEGETPRVTIVDTPGRLDLNGHGGREMAEAMIRSSDRLVVVTEKSPFSIRATEPMVSLIRECKREDSVARLLFNKVRANTRVGKKDDGALIEALGMPALKNSLPLAAPFENVQLDGYKAVTGRYRELVLKLALEILQ